VRTERAFLVGVLLPGQQVDPYNPLGELAALAEAAGAIVLDGLVQKRSTPCAATYLGQGKLEELAQRCQAAGASVILFDNDLSPAQIRNIEEVTGCKVLDRSELILDIFATRARTKEARLQVELAQLQYTAPRLRGMWTHLERIAGAGGGTGAGAVGGIGTRGPGERQLEIDRRIVADRIAHLEREIARVTQRKSREVQSRANEFTVSLVGYTNSGKSTLMNALTDAGRQVADALFVTLDTKTARWRLDEGRGALLSDTVGFVRDLPHRLVASFRATLEEAIHADLLLHVVDATAPSAAQQIAAVQAVLAELGCQDRPTVTLLNKMDAVQDLSVVQVLENRIPRCLRISAKTGAGLDALVREVLTEVERQTVPALLRAPAADGKLLAAIDQTAQVLDRRYDAQDGAATVELSVRIDRRRLAQLTGRFPQLQLIGDGNGTSS